MPSTTSRTRIWHRGAAGGGRRRLTSVARLLGAALVKLVLTVLVVSIVVFAATDAIPGNPARDVLGQFATQSQLQAFRQEHGFDKPVVTRYASWLADFARGDWGRTYAANLPVTSAIRPRLARTLVLAVVGFLLAAIVGVSLGLLTGYRPGRAGDFVTSAATLTVGAMPSFVIGLLLALVLAVWLRWLPVASTDAGLASSPLHAVRAYTLPALTLAAAIVPYVMRLTRANTRQVAGEPYVRSAVLRGIAGPRLLGRHVLPNAAPPIVNLLALEFVGSIGGIVVIETLFGFPGIGQLLVESVGARDIPTIQALALLLGGFFVVTNVVADLVVAFLTPKLRPAS